MIVLCFVSSRSYRNGYYSGRGYSTRHTRWIPLMHRGVNRKGEVINRNPASSRSGGGGGSSCACACACACAGGGRAGCSRKDFYNPNLVIEGFLENSYLDDLEIK